MVHHRAVHQATRVVHWMQCSWYSPVENALRSFHNVLQLGSTQQYSGGNVYGAVCREQTNRRLRLPPTQCSEGRLMPGPWNNLTVLQLAQVWELIQEEEKKNPESFLEQNPLDIVYTIVRIEGWASKRFKEDIGLHQFEANLMIRFHHLEGWVNVHFDLI